MFETEASGPVALPPNITNAFSGQTHHTSNVTASLGNLGTFTVTVVDSPTRRLSVRLALSIPVSNAEIRIFVDNQANPRFIVPYTGVNILEQTWVINNPTGPNQMPQGSRWSISVIIESEEDWSFTSASLPEVANPYTIFRQIDDVGTTYFWLDGNFGRSSDGPVEFCTLPGYQFIIPPVEDVFRPEFLGIEDGIEIYKKPATIYIPTGADTLGALWLPDSNGPDLKDPITQWNQPLVLGHTYEGLIGQVSRLSQDLLLGTERMGTYDIVLLAATTTQDGSNNNHRFTNNPIRIRVNLNLDPVRMDPFVETFTVTGLTPNTTLVETNPAERYFILERTGSPPVPDFGFTLNFTYVE
jgi:hypothetical protein